MALEGKGRIHPTAEMSLPNRPARCADSSASTVVRAPIIWIQHARMTPRLFHHRSKDMVPKSCADAVVSRRELMVAFVVPEQW
jgi:hypothetical protein